MKILRRNDKINRLAIRDNNYPTNLKYIYDPPSPIYIKGNIIPEDNIAIAIVGSRRATYYGLKNAESLSYRLAAKGITIVSGLARGIDSAAHRGALKAKGRTIAVLGSGLNVIYPEENKDLAERISQNGALISEFPLDTQPQPYNFPRRNRIISGLSLGVVVVEAAKKSGALITANCASEQGREVFALPGKVDSPTSEGTHDLIKQGAKLVQSIEDIIEELEPLRSWQAAGITTETVAGPKPLLSEDEQQIYSCLGPTVVHLDEIMQKTSLPYGRLLSCLLKLEYKQLVKELPGKLFVKQ